jgi:hypothetical protein
MAGYGVPTEEAGMSEQTTEFDYAGREALIVAAARAMHECTSHPDYPDYDEAPCCGTPSPALVNPPQFHRDMDHEKGSRGVCWGCEPLAAAAVDAILALSTPPASAVVETCPVSGTRLDPDPWSTLKGVE